MMRSTLLVCLAAAGLAQATARSAPSANATNVSAGAHANASVVPVGHFAKKADTPTPEKLPVPWKEMAAKLHKLPHSEPHHPKKAPKQAPKQAWERHATTTTTTAHSKVPDEKELNKYERAKHTKQFAADINDQYAAAAEHLAKDPPKKMMGSSPNKSQAVPSNKTRSHNLTHAIEKLHNKTSDVAGFAKFLGKTKAFMKSISKPGQGLAKLEEVAPPPTKKHKLPNSQMKNHLASKLEDRRHGAFYFPAVAKDSAQTEIQDPKMNKFVKGLSKTKDFMRSITHPVTH